jgi:anaerobic magnesium-protoporphyrin IX monomethyl ester cyclase
MCDILFGQSYFLRFDPKLWRAMQPYPPLGTLYAASYLRARGYRVELFDAMLAESENEWALALDRHQPRFAVLFEDNFNYLSKMCLLRMRQAAFTMIQMAHRRGCIVVVAGADASDHYLSYLAQGADYILIGEGEITLGELLDRLSGRSSVPLESILGLAFVSSENPNRGENEQQVIATPRRPDFTRLDDLPFPAWDLVDIFRYREIWYKRHGYYSMNMVTTRGCPFHCNWCAKPIWGQRYNSRSPENVVAELKWLKENYYPDHIWFVDDILGLKPGWISRFTELVNARNALVPFKCLSRVDLLLRPGEIPALEKAGCQIVWVGAESGSQQVLNAMDKGTQVAQIYQATRLLHEAGVQVGFYLQFGYPGESRSEIEKTLQMVRDCRPDDIGMSVSYPLPGTKFYDAVKEQLGSRRNWVDSNDLAMLYQGPFTTQFYRQLHVVLHKEFRSVKAWDRIRARFRIERTRKIEIDSYLHFKSTGKKLLSDIFIWFYNRLTLFPARARLDKLEKLPQQGLKISPQLLSPDEAAIPTPQAE